MTKLILLFTKILLLIVVNEVVNLDEIQ